MGRYLKDQQRAGQELIECEEDRIVRAVLVGMLREMGRSGLLSGSNPSTPRIGAGG